MTNMLRRTWAEIYLGRLECNARRIRQMLEPGCRMMGIVKADAYGHGAVPVARTLSRAGVSWFGVSNLEEAIQLRRGGLTQPILVISYTPPTEAARLARYQVTQTVLSLEYARELNQAAVAAKVQIPVHMKIDTGMSRVGFVCHEEGDLAEATRQVVEACRLPALRAEGIFTHFSSADEEDDGGFTRRQFELFMAVIDRAGQQGVRFALRHCCNSAATLRYPEMHLDMVRPGIILYGLAPDRWMTEQLSAFEPVMELKCAVSMVKDLPAGACLGYNRTYTTADRVRVATVPVGYADGYARCLSNRARMLVKGQDARIIGRVCMDQCMLDVTGIPEIGEGTVVTLFGRDGEAYLPVDELAAQIGTVNYEVICLLSKRVLRRYIDEKNGPVGQLNYIVPED